jgi:hypothetical protein
MATLGRRGAVIESGYLGQRGGVTDKRCVVQCRDRSERLRVRQSLGERTGQQVIETLSLMTRFWAQSFPLLPMISNETVPTQPSV